jgi:hypothetical protein
LPYISRQESRDADLAGPEVLEDHDVFRRSQSDFHIVTKTGQEAQIEIATLRVMAGAVEKRVLVAALEWAARRQIFLLGKWREFQLPPV